MQTPPLRLTRNLVDRIARSAPDPGRDPERAHLFTPKARKAARDAAWAAHPEPGRPIWVFAFGSLIWKPEVPVAERRTARLMGWERAFCLGPDPRHRGNPDAPSLMLSLRQAATGVCEGVALRLEDSRARDDLLTIICREPPFAPIWTTLETDQGPVTALVFVCDPTQHYVSGLTSAEIAAQIAPAVGIFGSMADYVLNTAIRLESLGIHDPVIWEMQELVAAQLEPLPRRSATYIPAPPISKPELRAAFDAVPEPARKTLLALRARIFDLAPQLQGVGPLTETLKWGQPAYLTDESKSGTTIRLGLTKTGNPALFVHCQTRLINDMRSTMPDALHYDGTRAVLFESGVELPQEPLDMLIQNALTYHQDRG